MTKTNVLRCVGVFCAGLILGAAFSRSYIGHLNDIVEEVSGPTVAPPLQRVHEQPLDNDIDVSVRPERASTAEDMFEKLSCIRDPLLRRKALQDPELIGQIKTLDDFMRLGLNALVEGAKTDAIAYDWLLAFLDTGTTWAEEYVCQLSRESGPASVVARAVLLSVSEPWARKGFEGIVAAEKDPERRGAILDQALDGSASWVAEVLWQARTEADESLLRDLAQRSLAEYEYQVPPTHPRYTLFTSVLASDSPQIRREALRFLLDESHVVHPGGSEWSTDLAIQTFRNATNEVQVQMIDTLGDVMRSRLEADEWGNIGQMGNIPAMTSLLREGLESSTPAVRDAAQGMIQAVFQEVDMVQLRDEIMRERELISYLQQQVRF